MAVTAAFDLETCLFDATNAFSNAELDEDVYVPFPEGEDPNLGYRILHAYPRPTCIPSIFDSAFADDSITRRSSADYLITLFGGLIDWKSYKQRSMTTSTTEVELHTLTEAAREVYHWKRIFRDLGLCLDHDITTGCDTFAFSLRNR